MDETYVKVGGQWKYLFLAVDKHGHLIDFMLSERRNNRAAQRFLSKAVTIMQNWTPTSITTDKLLSYPQAIKRLKHDGQLPEKTFSERTPYLTRPRVDLPALAALQFTSCCVPWRPFYVQRALLTRPLG